MGLVGEGAWFSELLFEFSLLPFVFPLLMVGGRKATLSLFFKLK